ncbi:MAG: hypothetical protein ACYTKD_22720 [Planctomycetota bacterium]|jgi:hypothetical protein
MNGLARAGAVLGLAAVAAALPASSARAAAEASMDFYAPMARAISRGARPPTVWESPPAKSSWRGQSVAPQHLEEMRGLCASALAARFPGREDDYVLAVERGSVRLKAPEDVRRAAGEIVGRLLVARRMEVGLTLEHYALSRRAASRLDSLGGAILDEETDGWLVSAARAPGGGEAVLLGHLSAAGVANDELAADNVAPVPVAYLTQGKGGAQAVTCLKVQRGSWTSARVRPSGPTRWGVALRALFAPRVEVALQEAEVALAVGQAAVREKATLRLPRWRSLGFCGSVVVAAGRPVLLALAGASDDPAPASAGKPFEALVLRIDSPFHSATEGPVALCFDGSALGPAPVLERMREIARARAEEEGLEPLPLDAWCGGSMMLLGDVSVRSVCLEALDELLPANDPQRLSVLMGARFPEGRRGASEVDEADAARIERSWWFGGGIVSVASAAAASGGQSSQLDLQAGEVPQALVGLGQGAVTDGVTLTAGCSGAGKRRRLAATASLGVPKADLAGAAGTAVTVDRLLGFGSGMLVPAGGRVPGGGALVRQRGAVVEAESPAGTVSGFQPAQMRH